MLLTIEQLRTRIGLADNDATRDDEILLASDFAMALCENYCDRKFPVSDDEEEYVHFDGVTVSVRRYPIVRVESITDYLGNDVKRFHIDHERGLIKFDDYSVVRHRLLVHYRGGYAMSAGQIDAPYEMPADVLAAVLMVFDQQIATGGGGGGLAAGAIQSVTLADVGTVRYATGAAADAAASSQDAIPPQAAAILSAYVRKYA